MYELEGEVSEWVFGELIKELEQELNMIEDIQMNT